MRGDLDREIDAVVSAMLDADSREDLRARVLERIAEPRRRWPLWWTFVPLAAAALLTLVIAGRWRTSDTGLPFIRSTSLSQAVPAIPASLPRGLNRDPMEPMRAASASVTRVARVSRLAPSEPATEVGVAPLERLASIDVAPVAVTRLDGQRIVVAPLASIEEIEIPPVGPPEGRN